MVLVVCEQGFCFTMEYETKIRLQTYTVTRSGAVLLDRDFMWEYAKLTSCMLVSFFNTLARVDTKATAGLVSNSTMQETILSSECRVLSINS